MNLALPFTRTLFVVLSVFLMTTYMVAGGYTVHNLGIGVGLGAALGLALIGFDLLFKRFNLRMFNVTLLGLFVGYLMGQALVWILDAILQISAASIHLQPALLEVVQMSLFLFGVYLGTLTTLRASDELSISIPFVQLTAEMQKKKDLIIDGSLLADPRMIDLASSGIVDHHLILPRFLIKELYMQVESSEDAARVRAKRSLDILKKLEAMDDLCIRYNETDFPDVKDPMGKLVRLARLLDANIMTADINRVQMAAIEGVRVVNLHTLSNALKPLMQTGEQIKIKIQRYGKEPRQGVGYLDDGTMVVVNGGGDYIGELIEAKVLSVKHTTSGRMIFCNAPDEEGGYHSYDDEGP